MRTWLQGHAIPRPAVALGAGGLIPFVVLAVTARFGGAMGLDRLVMGMAESMLLYYAAAILSFMGGAQWGLAMARPEASWRAYGISVLPSLVAVAILVLTTLGIANIAAACIAFAVGFVGLLAYDLATIRRGEAPLWYRPLRIALTAVVATALLLRATTWT